MKLKKILTPSIVLICVVLSLLAYFAYAIVFYDYGSNASGFSLSDAIVDTPLLSLQFLLAMTPFLIIIALSVLCILLCLWLRKRIIKKDPLMGRFANERTGAAKTAIKGQRRFGFMSIRWFIMSGSFLALVYGGKLLGQWYSYITIPIFACPLNQEQLIGSSCYYLAHLSSLFTLAWQDIALFFVTLIASLIVLGRMICGFLCPLGLLQDTVHEMRQGLKIEGISLNEKLYGRLKPIKWTMLLLFLGLVFVGGNFCNFCPAITLSPAFAGFRVSIFFSGFMMILVIVGGFFKRRFFCNVCPLGYLMGLFHKLSLFKIRKDCQSCTECGACYEACPMGIKEIYTEREKTDVTTADCILCGECIDKCPENNALSLSFCGFKFYRASRKTLMSGQKKNEKKMIRRIRKKAKNESDQ
jgi:polyferredoxin